ncbi:hypothetical protein CGCTS75_v002505 [Colletotrichum tropicale]|nr:hypothetical protein CGCTS75_v002505 [Colletotrichum tropicale]
MSGLEAFSMACNVMTVISFGLETIDLFRRINEVGSSDPKLANSAERIRKTSGQLEQLLNNEPQLGSAQRAMTTGAEKQLRDIAAECLQYSKDIEKQISSTSPKKSGLSRALKSTVKTVWQKRRLDQLKNHLEASRKDMDTTINVQILEECIRSGKLNYAIYTTLTEDNKSFIKTYSERSQVIEVLIEKISLQMTNQSSKLQKEFHARFDIMETSHHDQKAHDGLLQSLEYESMNERKNNIPNKHKETFEWIFEGQGSFGNGSAVKETTSETKDEQRWRGWLAVEAKEKQREADFLGWLEEDSPGPFWTIGPILHYKIGDINPKLSPTSFGNPERLINMIFLAFYAPYSTRPKLGHKRGVTDWDTDELQECLFETLRYNSRFYLVLLDGLDEHFNPHGGMDELFTFLYSLMQNDRVKLCILSRPERIFEDKFSSGRRLRMQDLVFSDILNYTVDFLERIGLKSTDSMKQAIIDEIDFSSPPPNFNSDIFFIYLAAVFGLYDYITDILDDSQDDVLGWVFLPNTRITRDDNNHITSIGEYTSILLEVNDNFLVRQLSNLVTFESKVILQAATEAAMRPLLARTGDIREPFDMFHCGLGNDEDVDEFWEWTAEGFCREGWPDFTDGAPSCLSLTYIGTFDDVFDALEEIDYPLPDVNQQHGCYHNLMEFCV